MTMSDHPNPLGDLRLFGLTDRRRDLVLTVLLIAVILTGRLLVFPASIWEQDEAAFAAAILDFDATDNRPHPPWFPLWIGFGKLVHLVGAGPAESLRIVSLVFSVWMIFPLTAMWSPLVGRGLAIGASLLFLVAPGPSFFSGRAFSGTTATALLVAALAFWLQARDRPRWLAAGSILASTAILVRPQFLPVAVGAMLVVGIRIPAKQRLRMLAAFVTPLCVGALILIAVSDGVVPLWSALTTHGEYHFSRLEEAPHGLAESGLSRSLGHPAVAVGWLILFHIGMIRLIRAGRWRAISPILIGALLPLLVVIHGFSNPAHARYAVPMLALTSGFVALGLNVIFGRRVWIAIAAAAVAATALTGPQLVAYRSTVSPAPAAIEEALVEAEHRRGVVVADRTLRAFFTLRRLERPLGVPVLFDHMIELGHVPPPPPEQTVYIFDAGRGTLLNSSERERRFACTIPLVEALSQNRFIDLRVASGASLKGSEQAKGPLVLID